ncbi:DNA polymerase III subunit beta [Natronosporangium hydrolyticum]|uniref:Beta sliding clamp n=1 Tax=Natronosporangium hydrolyticum TaxID=2811111 RepID=A0A895YH37_9ACTN|nr:DNA polymerase III subunit beta [Natronosporangium hydrolyticum]QSB14829.1 DNA polymerase III subunit beta [Natronosporangium hydrolyticum]
MKFRVERDALAEGVAWTAKGLPARPSVPVLAGVLLRVTDSQLQLSGFDYQVSSEASVTVHADAEGAALVSGKLLAEITKALPGKPVEIAAVDAHLELTCGSARFTLPTMPVEDYPSLPALPERAGTVDAAAFAAAVSQVALAAGKDETLPMMTGVRIEFNGGNLALLATDRYRLALREIDWQPDDPQLSANALVPAKILADTAKTLGPIGGELVVALAADGVGEGMIGFEAGERRTTSRLLDGANYPPVRNLFPANHAAQATVSVATLTEVVRRVSLVGERTAPVRLSFSGDGVVVEAGGTEEARASEAAEATFEGEEAMTLAFNPGYLLDGLGALNAPNAIFSFVEPGKPAVLSPGNEDGEQQSGYRYLIQPIRVVR